MAGVYFTKHYPSVCSFQALTICATDRANNFKQSEAVGLKRWKYGVKSLMNMKQKNLNKINVVSKYTFQTLIIYPFYQYSGPPNCGHSRTSTDDHVIFICGISMGNHSV